MTKECAQSDTPSTAATSPHARKAKGVAPAPGKDPGTGNASVSKTTKGMETKAGRRGKSPMPRMHRSRSPAPDTRAAGSGSHDV